MASRTVYSTLDYEWIIIGNQIKTFLEERFMGFDLLFLFMNEHSSLLLKYFKIGIRKSMT